MLYSTNLTLFKSVSLLLRKNYIQQMRNLFLLVLMALAVVSCKKDTVSYEEQLKIDSDKIEAYLAEKNLTAQKTASGLYYIITLEGTGLKPGPTSTVTVGYKGYFLDGTVFDQTYGSAWAQFNVSGVVPGFSEGLQLLKNKGKGTFFLPSGLAYGASGAGSIPANTPLIFEIDLVDFF